MDADVYESNFCPVTALSADNTFLTPTGPTSFRSPLRFSSCPRTGFSSTMYQAGLICFPFLFSLSKPGILPRVGFHLLILLSVVLVFLGIPRGTRTPTNGFGDRHAAITSERYKCGLCGRIRTYDLSLPRRER
jgi:hypothetical protein